MSHSYIKSFPKGGPIQAAGLSLDFPEETLAVSLACLDSPVSAFRPRRLPSSTDERDHLY